ncbi:facilitated trehalose transporter Tret1 isoform X2 [Aethina tumida]|uniref:facilitated trehalose transporter Tret1 isoform X2 n=1 Tax=Aethina tumida TaxID=116153 RepID=UPI0021492632|nr:facilitated trehalose transporter Tret1 isoform X2 [Aethina tumida]
MNVGASCISLYTTDAYKETSDTKETFQSTFSISKYESKSLKSLWPQIFAAVIAASFHIGNGISMAYSAVLIAQLDQPDSEIKPTQTEKAWMASVLIIVVPVASIACGFLMDGVGRLNTIKIAGIPGIIGWCMCAMANNIPVIIFGRLLVGLASAWGTSPAIVYISEIAHTDLRGSLMSVAPLYVSLGMVITYFLGYIMHWRALAWLCNVSVLIPCLMCVLIPESPSWLIWKGKNDQAKKSVNWFNKNQPKPNDKAETVAEMHFRLLQDEQEKKNEEAAKKGKKGASAIIKEFLKPTGYKPLIFFVGLFICQHFSGIYITMFYSIQFIEAAGTSINGYFASILIGVVRFAMSMVSTVLLKKHKRRTLMFISSSGMAVCMFLSGLFTQWIQEGKTTMTWLPVACILLYVVTSIIGVLPIPNMLLAELFPLEIRGTGYSIGYSICCMIMFSALQSYYTLSNMLGGAKNLQWFFSVTCLGALVYSYIFLPETKGVKLTDINTYFKHQSVYIGSHKKKRLEETDNNNRV